MRENQWYGFKFDNLSGKVERIEIDRDSFGGFGKGWIVEGF